MAVYYYKLWKLLEERGISKATLISATNLTKTPLRNMQNDESVSVDTLDKLCNYLKCDFGDIITNIPQEQPHIYSSPYISEANTKGRSLLSRYMKDNNLSVSTVSDITSISVNTLKAFINGKDISQKTIFKLFALGETFQSLLVQSVENIGEEGRTITYCIKCKTNRKKCLALRNNLNGNAYEPICLLNHKLHTEDKSVFTYEKCPRPTSISEFNRNAFAIGKKI